MHPMSCAPITSKECSNPLETLQIHALLLLPWLWPPTAASAGAPWFPPHHHNHQRLPTRVPLSNHKGQPRALLCHLPQARLEDTGQQTDRPLTWEQSNPMRHPRQCWGLSVGPRHQQGAPSSPRAMPCYHTSTRSQAGVSGSPHQLLLCFLPGSAPELFALRALPCSQGLAPAVCVAQAPGTVRSI